MFSLIKKVFIVLLGFSSSLATECVSLNDEPRIIRLTLIDLDPVELKYYPFMITINIMEVAMSYRQKYVLKKTKDINVKAFNMITNKNEAKTMIKHISCDCKCKFNSKTCNSNLKWNNEPCQCEFRNYCKCKNG